MKNVIRKSSWGLLALAFSSPLWAQDFSEYFISAKSGAVNYVEGRPLAYRFDQKKAKVVTARSQLQQGDRLETGEMDRAEILLNPGSYLRVSRNASLQMINSAYDGMQFSLNKGTVVLESAAFNRKVHSLKVSTPSGDMVILKEGLYRFEVNPGSGVEVLVHKGKAKWLKDGKEIASLGEGKRYSLDVSSPQGPVKIAKLNKSDKEPDEMDQWSKRRAEFLVTSNSRLSPGLWSSAYTNYNYSFRGGWVYNPFFNSFTFVPFDGMINSPYGYSYGMFYPVRYGYYNNGYYARGNGGVSGSRTTSVNERSSASTSSSSPASRGDSGRMDQQSRSGVHDQIRRR